MKRTFMFLLCLLLVMACQQPQKINPVIPVEQGVVKTSVLHRDSICVEAKDSDLDTTFIRYGLVNMKVLDSSIPVHLVYSTPDNFTGKILYPNLKSAWLRPEAAAMLVLAQQQLKQLYPELSLIIYDAVRPFHIQQEMWKAVKGTPMRYYVANPNKGGGLHNYGMAVDVTLIDANGNELPMGSPYDSPLAESHITDEKNLLASGKITEEAYSNRLLLRKVMCQTGFKTIQREWWHFNACSLSEAQQMYVLIP